jgi:hypothetical protein
LLLTMELVGAEDAPEGPSVVLDCDGLPDGGVLADSGALPVCEARPDSDVLLGVEADGADTPETEVDGGTVAEFELRALSLYMSPLFIFQSLNRSER